MEILCEMKPEYKGFVVYENGKATLYTQLMKALYQICMTVVRVLHGGTEGYGFQAEPI